MYKRASRNLQHAHRVDAPLPTGGYIGSTASEHDLIPSAGNMSYVECGNERRALLLELARAQNDMIAAKADGHAAVIRLLGHRIQGYVQRIALLKRRMHYLSQASQHQAFADAVRELVDADTFRAIAARKDQILAVTLTESHPA